MLRRDFLWLAGLGVIGLTVLSPLAWGQKPPEVPRDAFRASGGAWMHGFAKSGCASDVRLPLAQF